MRFKKNNIEWQRKTKTDLPVRSTQTGELLEKQLWKTADKLHKNIDARNHLINRRTNELSLKDIDKITSTYHNWRNEQTHGRASQ